MTITAFVKAIEEVSQARSVEEVTRCITTALNARGMEYFALLRQLKPHRNPLDLLLAGHMPDGWPKRYRERRYILVDPVVRFTGQAKRSFRWRDAVAAYAGTPYFRRMQRMYSDAQRHGLKDGYLLPVFSRQGLVGSMTVGGKPVDLSPGELAVLEALARGAFWRLIDMQSPDAYDTMPAPANLKLTHREMEALGCLSEGLTSPEIATILDISNHTVDWYMNGIQQKLQARNRHHTVAIAYRLGLIS